MKINNDQDGRIDQDAKKEEDEMGERGRLRKEKKKNGPERIEGTSAISIIDEVKI